jgi:hypothetical protein
MPITYTYAPPASSFGAAGFAAGRGKFETDERRLQEQRELQIQELLQRERMQSNQIAASRANVQDQLGAQLRGQLIGTVARQQEAVFDQFGRERLAAFGFMADQAGRAQQGQIQAELQRRQGLQQQQRDQQGFARDLAMEQVQSELAQQEEAAKQQERLNFAMREQEMKAAQIDAAAQQRVQAIRNQIGTNLRPADAERMIARIQEEAEAAKAGVKFDQSSVGPTPKEELKNQWNDRVLEIDGVPVQMTEEGTFEAIRGWKPPEDPQKVQQEQEAAKQKFEFEKAKQLADVRMKAFDGALKLMDKTITKQGKDAEGNPTSEEQPLFGSFDEAYQAALQMMNLGEEAAGQIEAAGQAVGAAGAAALTAPQAQMSVPAQAPAQPQAAAQPQQRPPIQSFEDFMDAWGQGGMPTDLAPTELRSIGLTVDSSQINPDFQESYNQLSLAFTQLPDTKESTYPRRALGVVMGAVAAYGPDSTQWPPQVRAQIAGDTAEVIRLMRGKDAAKQSR